MVDERERLLGVITDGDLRRTFQRIELGDLKNLQSGAIMTREPVVARPEMLAYEALRLMEDRPRQISVLPVVDGNGVCVGLMRVHDIVRSGL